MDSAFQWLNDLTRWFSRLVPHWRVVTEAQAGVAFVRGRPRLIQPGIFWWWPAWTEVHVQEVVRQTLNLPAQSLLSSDGTDIAVSGIVVYSIDDPLTAFVKVHDLDDAIQDMALATIKSVLWGRSVDDLCARAEVLDQILCAECKIKLKGWGVEIHNIFLSDLSNATVLRHMGPVDATAVPPRRETPQREEAQLQTL